MKKENPKQPEKVEVELSEDALEQVSGGFNPQPDPPCKTDKTHQYLSQGLLLPAVRPVVFKV